MASHPHPDSIADCVLDTFDALPAKFKPRHLADGRREWVPLAGIVLSKGAHNHATESTEDHDNSTSLTCVALATGMKCLPREKIPLARGNVLHDWHAEVLCLRGFNRWVVDECAATGKSQGEWLRRSERDEGGPPFTLQPNIKIHMYISSAPCGDASMELTMSSQSDATPWTSPPEGMLGRGHFDQLGIVRRKPSRADAPVCWSKSCSDKISLKACTGLVSGLGSLLVAACWLETLVLPEGEIVSEAVERAFGTGGRMKEGGFGLRPFAVKTTTREFTFSRSAAVDAAGGAPVPSNLSALHTPRRREILINGVLQGRKQMDPKGASCVSRRKMWESVLEVAEMLDLQALKSVLDKKRKYREVKECEMLQTRAQVKGNARKKALKGWKRNDGDEDWELEDSKSIES